MDKSGFTLLEMLFSILIITIIVGFVSYNIVYEVRRSQLTNGQYQVAGSLELARSCAMATRSGGQVIFEADRINVSCEHMSQEIIVDKVTLTTNFPADTAKFDEGGIINQGATIDVCNQSGCRAVTVGVGSSDVQIK